MIVFDLREEARLVSYLYLTGGLTLALLLVGLTHKWFQGRLWPATLGDAAFPLALVFALASLGLGWMEVDERQQAETLAAQCLAGQCDMVEGPVVSATPVRQVTQGSRYTAPMERGEFRVGDHVFFHYPRDHSDYSPANKLQPGQKVRVYSHQQVLVLVEEIH
ncbi:MAG: hypothetical protein LDL39_05380 [Magnetospirillum sp.]|nr:hypothetical protein [Magnetospirillum sp.]